MAEKKKIPDADLIYVACFLPLMLFSFFGD